MLTMDISNPNWLVMFGWLFAIVNVGITYYWFYAYMKQYKARARNLGQTYTDVRKACTDLDTAADRLSQTIEALADVGERCRDTLSRTRKEAGSVRND